MGLLASPDDVKRVLSIPLNDDTQDTEIGAALAAADQWVRREVRRVWVEPGDYTETFHDMRGNGKLWLPEAAEVTAVVTGEGAAVPFLRRERRPVRLRSSGDLTYDEVTVAYTVPASEIPADLVEATANVAAYLTADDPVAAADQAKEVESAKIGNFSYKLEKADSSEDDTGEDNSFMKTALVLLRGWRRSRARAS